MRKRLRARSKSSTSSAGRGDPSQERDMPAVRLANGSRRLKNDAAGVAAMGASQPVAGTLLPFGGTR